ncbi:MAG: hypothetical protein QM831_07880 [Kofleriaceae bacterium]
MSKWLVLLAACGSSSSPANGSDASAQPVHDAAIDAPRDGSGSGSGSDTVDGTPVRQPCTSNFGTALPNNGTFGRMDGYLVAIVPPSGMNSCNADTSHVHLQIKVNGEIYDIAIDATDGSTGVDDVHTYEMDGTLPGTAWTEGFHTGVTNDYVALGVHSSQLVLQTKQQVVDTLTADLATANHVSIYTTTYGDNGAHLVHRNGSGHDGMLVIDPLGPTSHFRLLSFSDQSF